MKLLALSFFFLSQVLAQVSVADVIELKSSVVVEPNHSLNLMDLVDKSHPETKAIVAEIESKLNQTIIMHLQEAGERIELSLHSVAGHLKLALDSKERQQYKFSIPRRIEVLVQSPELTEEYLAARLKREWQKSCKPCKVEIKDLRLPIGKFAQWEIDIPINVPKGSFNIPLTVKMKDGRESRYWVQGQVDILKEVPIAQRALYVGERVQAEDFKYQWRSITYANDGAPAKNLILGSQVRIPVSANQVIWSRHLAKEKALKRGDQVRVYSSGKLWELSLSAVAEKDAEIGDTVTLKNPRTNKRLIGLVVGKGEVEVK